MWFYLLSGRTHSSNEELSSSYNWGLSWIEQGCSFRNIVAQITCMALKELDWRSEDICWFIPKRWWYAKNSICSIMSWRLQMRVSETPVWLTRPMGVSWSGVVWSSDWPNQGSKLVLKISLLPKYQYRYPKEQTECVKRAILVSQTANRWIQVSNLYSGQRYTGMSDNK